MCEKDKFGTLILSHSPTKQSTSRLLLIQTLPPKKKYLAKDFPVLFVAGKKIIVTAKVHIAKGSFCKNVQQKQVLHGLLTTLSTGRDSENLHT